MKLLPFQEEDVAKMLAHERFLNCNPPGLGKTVEALSVTAQRQSEGVLVVCPASLKQNWSNEAQLWVPSLKPVVLYGRDSFRLPQPGEIVIVNPELLPRQRIAPSKYPRGMQIHVDEFHQYKNAKSLRYQSLDHIIDTTLRLAGGAVAGYTGTPIYRDLSDLYYELKLLRLGAKTWRNKAAFDTLVGAQERFIKRWSEKAHGFIEQRIDPFYPPLNNYRRIVLNSVIRPVTIRRHIGDVGEQLPPVYHKWLVVPIGGDAAKLAYEALQEISRNGMDFEAAVDYVLNHRHGVAFETFSRCAAALATAKIPALNELLDSYEAAGEPVVVAAAHRAIIEQLNAREGWATITGTTPAHKRQQIVEAFQAGQLKGVGLTLQAGGLGLTLTRARIVVMPDMDPTEALNEQGWKRAHRISQERTVYVVHLISDHPLEKGLLQITNYKRQLAWGIGGA